MAEREGFEPSIRCRIHTFQACSFNHSDTSPDFLPYTEFIYLCVSSCTELAGVLVIRLLRSLTPSGPPSLRSDVLSATPQVNHSDTSPDFLPYTEFIYLCVSSCTELAGVLVIRLLRSLTPSGPPSLRSDVLSATPQVNHSDTSPGTA